jgi:hypothetical protein
MGALSILIGIIYAWRRSLIAAIVTHVVYDALLAILG